MNDVLADSWVNLAVWWIVFGVLGWLLWFAARTDARERRELVDEAARAAERGEAMVANTRSRARASTAWLLCMWPDCPVRITHAHMMCPDHWEAVPIEVRAQFRALRAEGRTTAAWRLLTASLPSVEVGA